MRERAVRFGKSTSLIAVLSEPAAGVERRDVGVVFLNSGILHHVGACRLHVRLARRLAESGIASIRFDLSGMGDSEARKDSLSFDQSAQLEVREAMDHLAAKARVNKFVLIGLCSGADMGFFVSQNDERVVGLVQLDAFAYRTNGYWVRHYAPRLLQLGVWSNFIKRKLGLIKVANNGKGPEPGADYVRPEYRRVFPPREKVEAGLRALAGRGVELLFLFSGGQSQHYNHKSQYVSSFRTVDFRGCIQVEYYGDADHLFSGLEHQRIVDDVICSWLLDRVKPAAAAPAAEHGARPVAAMTGRGDVVRVGA